jgi:hypothetical protein
MNRHVQALVASAVTLAACFLGTSTATAQLPEDGRKALAYFVGHWTYEADGGKYSGTWSAKWSPDESCLLGHVAGTGPDGPRKMTFMTGWDSAKSQLVEVRFSDDGGHSLSRIKIESDQVVLGERTGSRDGKAYLSRTRLDKERNKFTTTISDRVVGGTKLPDLVIVHQRVADKK